VAKSALTILEKDLWAIFKTGLDKLDNTDYQRIESPSTGFGIPDVNISYASIDFWVELKIVDGNRIKFERGQPGWLRNRWRAGGLSWVLARKVTKHTDVLMVWRGEDAVELSKKGREKSTSSFPCVKNSLSRNI